MRPLRATFVTLLAALAAGCSLSASSESSSKIVSSPIESSSKSSESSLKSSEARYRDDVRDHTAAWVRGGGGDAAAFLAQLPELAHRRGVADWEASSATWEGVGEGLARAGVKGADFESYLLSLTGSDAAKMATVRAAYERAEK
jgi:hypothetical protein